MAAVAVVTAPFFAAIIIATRQVVGVSSLGDIVLMPLDGRGVMSGCAVVAVLHMHSKLDCSVHEACTRTCMIILHAFFDLALFLLACGQQRLVPPLPRGDVMMKDAEHKDIHGRPQ